MIFDDQAWKADKDRDALAMLHAVRRRDSRLQDWMDRYIDQFDKHWYLHFKTRHKAGYWQ